MKNTITITKSNITSQLLPMQGKDEKGNLFQVDQISFLKNGKRFIPVMGEFHFSRWEPEGWEEELLKMRAGGIDIVATYVFWIHHEERQGEWDFSGCRDLRAFLEVCRKINMSVWLRIGPWAHGECRNGGFPDWVVSGNWTERTNDPAYLELVKTFYGKLGEQARGEMAKDGGPVLGIQIENEYGHCGGPADETEGMAHMRMLKKMAVEAGFETPYYTATGWGGAYVVEREMLPVLGGYVDAPWDTSVKEIPPSENFIFAPYKQDENIGSDFKKEQKERLTYDKRISPYLTAELGGGLQVTNHRRTYPWPEDIEAQALCMLGSGANLLGYYMYHGGINPDGKYSTLQESRETGYINDLPIKSYDFQTCIRESGEINASFGRLKKIHLFLHDFGELLAGADAYFSEIQPESAEDRKTLRVTARVNQEEGVGFLFINNHQRKRKMEDQEGVSVRLLFKETEGRCTEEMEISDLTVKGGECAILPFMLPGTENRHHLPTKTNASILARIGRRTFFYTEETRKAAVYFEWNGQQEEVVVLSKKEADRAFRIGNHLYIVEHSNSCLICDKDQIYLITKYPQETIEIYGETGNVKRIIVQTETDCGRTQIPAEVKLLTEQKAEDGCLLYREYLVRISGNQKNSTDGIWNNQYLALNYLGDRAEVYINERLADDWFTTGELWKMSLKRFGYPETLTVRIYPSDQPLPNPYGNQVYYDLPVESGCELRSAATIPEYKIPLDDSDSIVSFRR